MNLKRQVSLVLVSLILLSATAIAAPTNNIVPIASFSASPLSGYAPMNVTFTNKSIGEPTSWRWTFGDGTNSTAENPSHTYSEKGKCPVTLIVKNKAGKDSLSRYSYINVLAPKKAVNVNSSTSPLSRMHRF